MIKQDNSRSDLDSATDGQVETESGMAVEPSPGAAKVEAPEEDARRPEDAPIAQQPVDTALVSMNFSVRITADDAAKLSDEQMRTLLDFAEKMRGK